MKNKFSINQSNQTVYGNQQNHGGRKIVNSGRITNSNINMIGNGRIVIDGREFHGNSVSISNGRVVIDGVMQDGELVGDINIEVYGDVKSLETTCGNVTARNVGNISTTSGDVKCGDVSGNIQTTSGDVECGNIGGNVKTSSGDITAKKW